MEKYTIKLILLLMKYYNFNILQFFLNLLYITPPNLQFKFNF